ncbi:MAG: DinB family protein [Dehalococcoidia bacterium]
MAATPIEDFRSHWEFVHGMTLAFAEEVPDERWEFSPHPRFAPFCKQLRHVVCVRGVYNDALVSGHADFSRKHEHYAGGLTRDDLVRALVEQHEQLLAIVASPELNATIEAFGRSFSFGEYTHVMIQHESIHQGQWSIYAALGGFETPLLWRLEWGL